MPGIAAIIVTFNRKDKLKNCIRGILRQTSDIRPDIIVIDNASSDGTGDAFSGGDPEYMRPDIHYYNTGMNTGGAGGFCYGIRLAAEMGYDYVWLMDDDCVPAETALAEFIRFDRSHIGRYGFLTGRILWRDSSLCRMNIQREKVTSNVRDWDRSAIPVVMASFVSLFIPVSVIRETGLPFRQFYIWTDDWEYTRRISRHYPCYLITDSTAIHDTDMNTKADIATAPEERIDRFRYLYRNDVYLYRREGLKGLCYQTVRLTAHMVRIAACGRGMKMGEKIRRMGILIEGTIEGFSFYPDPERL